MQLYYRTALHFTTIKPYLVGHNLNKMSKKQVLVGIRLLDKLANTRTTKAKPRSKPIQQGRRRVEGVQRWQFLSIPDIVYRDGVLRGNF